MFILISSTYRLQTIDTVKGVISLTSASEESKTHNNIGRCCSLQYAAVADAINVG